MVFGKYMKRVITKQQIIEALETEPLTAGMFAATPMDSTPEDYETCNVCAVGAIMRSVLKIKPNYDHGTFLTNNRYSREHLKDAYKAFKANPNKFLGFLSCEFEAFDDQFREQTDWIGEGRTEEELRDAALSIVYAFCPDIITIDFSELNK